MSMTPDQKAALETDLAEIMSRGTLCNPSVEQAEHLGHLCAEFVDVQKKALALPVSPSQKNRVTARVRAKHDALREQIIALAVEIVGAEHLAELICKSLEPDPKPAPTPTGQAALPLGDETP